MNLGQSGPMTHEFVRLSQIAAWAEFRIVRREAQLSRLQLTLPKVQAVGIFKTLA